MIKILMVDDHPIVRIGVQKILSLTDDIEVAGEASNANEALEKASKNSYDLILLDITMPGRSGIDIIQDLKKINPKIPILILTMHSEDLYAIRAIKSGASGYLTKESVSEKLVNAIRLILSGKRYVSAELVELLAANLENDTKKQPHEFLSNREYEVMCSIAGGKTVEEISENLNLSASTVHTYRRRILEKIGFNSNAEIIHYCISNKLV